MGNRADATSYATPASRSPLGAAFGFLATVVSVGWTVIAAPLAALFAWLGNYHAVTVVSRAWARAIIATCGVRVQIEGIEILAGLKQCVIVANHQSFFDIFALAAFVPGEPRFVAKRELLRIPVIGYALAHSKHVIIERQSGGKAIRAAIDVIRGGFNICVFAEGHRHNDNRVHEFNDGGAWLAILGELPVVPMAICGSGALMPRGARFVRPGGKMRLRIGAPIATVGMKSADRSALTRKIEDAVRAMFVEEV